MNRIKYSKKSVKFSVPLVKNPVIPINGIGVPCPHCGSGRTKILKTKMPLRYHKCIECEGTFTTKDNSV